MITYIKGDLFSYQGHLAHCVSRDMVLGKGIAKIFRSKFGHVKMFSDQQRKVGEVAAITHGSFSVKEKIIPRYLFYLVTKDRARDLPTYEDLFSSLVNMKNICTANNLTELAMPLIGCGLDRLEWSQVVRLLDILFPDTNIYVYVLPHEWHKVSYHVSMGGSFNQ